jgi:hypothetical protein
VTEDELNLLVERIKGRITNFGIEGRCWPWTGAKTMEGPRLQKMRTRSHAAFLQPVISKPYGLVKLGKNKRKAPHKIVFEWSTPHILKSAKYRLLNECGDTLCCNPAHWAFRDRDSAMLEDVFTPPEPGSDDLHRECRDLLESLLAVDQPRNFDDIRNHPYMIDFQPELIKEVLRGIGKGHLAG